MRLENAISDAAPGAGLRRSILLREIPSLAGLRALASLSVVLCHVVAVRFPGRQAVTLFFVLSGFLITLLLRAEIERLGTINILAFYGRRARRLLPAYYVFLFAVVLLLTGRVTAEIAAAAAYLSDYYSAWVNQGLISHTWSLSVEEHFYLVWPAVLLCVNGWKAKYRVMFAAIAAVQIARLVLGDRYPIYFFYSFETRLDALLMGCALALWVKDELPLPRFLFSRRGWVIPLAGLLVCDFLPLFWMRAAGDTVGAWCSAAIIIQTINRPPAVLNNRVTSALGAWSYSLYLWHVAVRWVYMSLVQSADGGGFVVHGWVNRMAVIALSITVAWASHTYVERPFLRGAGKASAPAPDLAVANS
jgi:peptidoglycan/LPS O-acetylase OafA/YrhL